MRVAEIVASGGGLLIIILTLFQIAPIKINPWSSIAKALGKAINADIAKQIDEVKEKQTELRKTLDEHIRTDGERDADSYRTRILQFNTEVMRGLLHTEEDFNEVLAEIDRYERYCKNNPDYPNKRAIHAVGNIERVYRERLEKNDFLK